MDGKGQTVELGGVAGTGLLISLGHFCHMVEPILADVSYAIGILVGLATLYKILRGKK